ncbi:MAG TPA: SDR family oxidoreductase [Verrucomicrobiae bacterium]|jgi:NAD(P)-dependent dehydrogenase (short-subunit alcohol dehydrogenase family)|nr:SDR family oxidoreductase [Verrucomicrobiae bacterium]
MDMFDLTGHVAAVIGGTGVLGGVLCHGLGRAGAAVAVMGRSAERGAARLAALEVEGIRAISVVVDATDRASLDAARRETEERLGPVDILVNAAGVNSSTPFFEIELEEWHRVLDANLTSVFLACQVFGKAMVGRGGGSIINISSASSGPPLSRVATYSVAKAGLNNLTQYLARELAPSRVRVNAIAPGFFPAEQNRALLSEERVRAILGHTPAGRLGESEELIGAAVWLAAERASSFVTGAIVRVDGGFSAMTI